MEQKAKVVRVGPEGEAQVAVLRQSACSGDCHQCAGCGAVEQMLMVDAYNAIGAEPGDLVTVRAASGPVLAAAAIVYMLPLALFFPGYLLGRSLWQRGGLMGCGAFVLGLLLAVIYDRRIAKKKKTVYTITGFAQNHGS